MTTYQTSIVAGVFRDNAQAQKAVEALRSAGFKYDQVGVAMRNAPNATQNLHDDLVKLGVPDDMASFYEKEYQNGHIVVSIRPDGRDEEARDVLRQHGAYDFSSVMNPNPDTQGRPDPNRPTEGRPDSSNYGQQDWHPGMGGQQTRPPDQQPRS